MTPKPGTQSALATQRSVGEWGRGGARERQRLRPAALPRGSGSSPACLEAPGWPAGAPDTDALHTGWPQGVAHFQQHEAALRAVNLPAPDISGPHSPAVSPLPREHRASRSNLSLSLSSLNKGSSFQHKTGARLQWDCQGRGRQPRSHWPPRPRTGWAKTEGNGASLSPGPLAALLTEA